jgi:Tol biopolymer transport system component
LPVWSPDGREIITTDPNATPDGEGFTNVTWRANRDGTNVRKLPIPATDIVLEWSPDRHWLRTFRKGEMPEWYLVRPDGSEERRLPNQGTFSPDGRHLLYQYDHGDIQLLGREIRVFDLETGEHRTVYRAQTDLLARANTYSWSPDGKHIVAIVVNWEGRYLIRPPTADSRLMIMDADGGNPREFRLADARDLWIVNAQWQ